METDRLKWDRKWTAKPEAGTPLPLVANFLPKSGIKALDLACGRGRHALLMAEAGFEVDALDISSVALAPLDHPKIHPLCIDLDTYTPPSNHYDLVIATYFLDRRLFPGIAAALKPGGTLIFETFLADSAHIETPAYKLAPGELREAFAHLETVFYEEHDHVARLVARRGASR